MSRKWKRWRWSLGLLPPLAALGIWWVGFSLPAKLFDAPYAHLLQDRDGQLLSAHIAADGQWRFPEPEIIPEKFATALIQFEDKRFLQHGGVDFFALGRALRDNLGQGRVQSGASTLSMQVIRLSRDNPPRTFSEKFLEILRAWRLETRLDKQDILRLYASHAPFGGNVVGLEAASWRYFGRGPDRLSWAESAMLAVLPNNPALIHPGRNRARLLSKRNRLLARLHQRGLLPDLDYQLALAEQLPDAPHPLPRLAPHLLDTLAKAEPDAHRHLSTLDVGLQEQVLSLAERYGEQLALAGIQNLAILVMDNQSMEARAYVGNRPMSVQGEHGHAIDMVQRPRSTGSTLKPLLFADMLENGLILPDSLVPDVPVSYSGFTPKNFNRNFQGAVSAREALARSLNVPMVNMLSQRGVEAFLTLLRQMGFEHMKRPASEYGLSLILGGAEASLWELVQSYAMLAHRASQPEASQRQTWLSGAMELNRERPKGQFASLSTATAWMTLDSMLEVARPGDEGYWRKFSSARKLAWKTGTSYGQRDAWAIGVTPRYSIGVWVGNADGVGRAGLTGTLGAAPVLFNVLSLLPREPGWFERPDWQLTDISVCQDDGYLGNGACATRLVKAPLSSHFSRFTPYHQLVNLDASGQWQVDSDCQPVSAMQTLGWFVLPPDQSIYYRQHHAGYQPPPPFRPDCAGVFSTQQQSLSLLYPQENTQIYLPRELDGKLGKTVLRAAVQQQDGILYWHLDDQFIGTTRTFHQQAVQPTPGRHRLTIVDAEGNQIEREFEVLVSAE